MTTPAKARKIGVAGRIEIVQPGNAPPTDTGMLRSSLPIGQKYGIPPIVPALNMSAQLRRFREAAFLAAQVAAHSACEPDMPLHLREIMAEMDAGFAAGCAGSPRDWSKLDHWHIGYWVGLRKRYKATRRYP